MKKLFIICCFFISSLSLAQNPVLNPGFENWSNNEPDNWLTLNVQGVAVPCQKTDDSHSGNYAMKGEMVPFTGGLLWTPYLVSTNSSGDPFPVNQLFSELSFYYQLDLKGVGEFFSAFVVISDAEGNGIGAGELSLYANANTEVYTLAHVPISYIFGSPAGGIISFAISDTLDGGGVVSGSHYIIDDVSLDNLSGVEALIGGETVKAAYPNPASADLNIPFVLTNSSKVTINIYNMLGRKVSGSEYGMMHAGSYKEVIDVSTWNSGVYYCVMTTSTGQTKVEFVVTENN